jgi:rSAM/selenodomain-associated transferase 1
VNRAAGLTLLVLAKEPVPGRVKTRLCPPCSPRQAAGLAAAALADTLAVVTAVPARRRVLVLDGRPGPWVPPGVHVVPQAPGDLAARLAAAFATAAGPALLIGMDTPQVTPRLLAAAATRLTSPATRAVLGLARDGGWWALGLRRPDHRVFERVPMGSPHTGARQLQRLVELDLRPALLPALEDVDAYPAALEVARRAPTTRFARAVAALDLSSEDGAVA